MGGWAPAHTEAVCGHALAALAEHSRSDDELTDADKRLRYAAERLTLAGRTRAAALCHSRLARLHERAGNTGEATAWGQQAASHTSIICSARLANDLARSRQQPGAAFDAHRAPRRGERTDSDGIGVLVNPATWGRPGISQPHQRDATSPPSRATGYTPPAPGRSAPVTSAPPGPGGQPVSTKGRSAMSSFIPPDARAWPRPWRVPTGLDMEHLEAAYRRGLLPVQAPLLHQPVPPVRLGSGAAKKVAEALYRVAQQQAEAGAGRMVGLAAPQVGIAARAFLFDPRESPADPWPHVEELPCLINPTVEPLGPTQEREMEGCLSTGRIRGWVTRAARVRVSGYTHTGERVDQEYTGLAARVLQHEADHLDGILFPDRITDDDDLLWVSADHDEQFLSYVRACRRGEGLPWNDRLPRDQWEAIREGLSVFGHLGEPFDRLIPTETGHG
jgi:peptide deformylase